MLRDPEELADAEEQRQDMIDQIVEAIQELEIKAPPVTVNIGKPEIKVELQSPKVEPVVNISPQAARIEIPPPNPHPFAAGATCTITRRSRSGLIEEFTIKPILS